MCSRTRVPLTCNHHQLSHTNSLRLTLKLLAHYSEGQRNEQATIMTFVQLLAPVSHCFCSLHHHHPELMLAFCNRFPPHRSRDAVKEPSESLIERNLTSEEKPELQPDSSRCDLQPSSTRTRPSPRLSRTRPMATPASTVKTPTRTTSEYTRPLSGLLLFACTRSSADSSCHSAQSVTSFGRDTHVNQSAIVGGGGNHSASGGLSSQGLSGSGVPGAQGTGPDNTADRSGGLSHRQDTHSGVASGLGAGAGAAGLAGHHSARGATTGAGVPSSQAYLGGTGEIGHIGSGYTQTLDSGVAGATNTGPTSGQGHGRAVGNTSSEHDVGAGLGSGAGPGGAGVGSTTGSHGVAPTGTGVTTNHEHGTNPSAPSGHSVAGAPLVAGAGLAGAGLASGAALDSSHSKHGEHGEHDHTHGELLANHESATGKNKARRPIIEEDKKGKYSDAAPGVPIGGIAYPDEIPQGGIRSDCKSSTFAEFELSQLFVDVRLFLHQTIRSATASVPAIPMATLTLRRTTRPRRASSTRSRASSAWRQVRSTVSTTAPTNLPRRKPGSTLGPDFKSNLPRIHFSLYFIHIHETCVLLFVCGRKIKREKDVMWQDRAESMSSD